MPVQLDRATKLGVVLAFVVTIAACTAESPASTPQAPAPAILFQHPTIELAWETAVERRRPLVVMFTSEHCPHCERMLKDTYGDAAIRQFLFEHSETALAHAADYAELIKKLKIRGFPTTLVISADGQIADAIEGYVDAPTFARRVQRWVGPNAVARAPQTAGVVAAQ